MDFTARGGAQRAAPGRARRLSTWLLLALFVAVVWDVQRLLFWFAMDNGVHWFCDAVTI
jgi:hypothetical protein